MDSFESFLSILLLTNTLLLHSARLGAFSISAKLLDSTWHALIGYSRSHDVSAGNGHIWSCPQMWGLRQATPKRAPNANYIYIHAIQYSIGLNNQYICNIIVLTTLMGGAIHYAPFPV